MEIFIIFRILFGFTFLYPLTYLGGKSFFIFTFNYLISLFTNFWLIRIYVLVPVLISILYKVIEYLLYITVYLIIKVSPFPK